MITQYVRPETLQQALELLADPNAIPLGGGTWINTPDFSKKLPSTATSSGITVVDLQGLGLNHISKNGDMLEIDACVTLQQLIEYQHIPDALSRATKLEAALNIRNAGTIAGTLVACDGRSPFVTTMLALDAKLFLQPGDQEITLGNLLPLRKSFLIKKLITRVSIPLNLKLSFEYVARTSADRPIVCASVAKWASGRTRVALGGYGNSPLLAMDGTEADDIPESARIAFHEAADEWASAEYRMEVATILTKRCLKNSRS
jgi:CO/xanthine dehydrogenase FAD-binding subunit